MVLCKHYLIPINEELKSTVFLLFHRTDSERLAWILDNTLFVKILLEVLTEDSVEDDLKG